LIKQKKTKKPKCL